MLGSSFGILSQFTAPLSAKSYTELQTLLRLPHTVNGTEVEDSGWGFGFYRHRIAYLFKKARPSLSDQRFKNFVNQVISDNIIIHQRDATVGDIKEANSQPFRYGQWFFAHKGTIQNFRKVRNRLNKILHPAFLKQIKGNTDSEYCMYLFLTLLKGKGAIKKGIIDIDLAVEALNKTAATLRSICSDIQSDQTSTWNFILSNGQYMLACRAGLPLHYMHYEPAPELEQRIIELPPGQTADYDEPGKYTMIGSNLQTAGKCWTEIPDNSVTVLNSDLSLHILPLTSD